MNIEPGQAVYRVRKSTRRGELPKGYRDTLDVVDERTQTVQACCDLVGRAVFGTHDIRDGEGRIWRMTANRKLAPSRWIVRDPEQRIAMQFDQKTLAKLTNPLCRVSLVVLDSANRELYRLIDPRKGVADLILGVGPGEWALMAGERPVGAMVWLPRTGTSPTRLLARLRHLLTSTDQGIVSTGAEHVLPAPVALGMVMIHAELLATSVD